MADIFCLFYDATTKTVRGINGSGRSPAALTLEYLRSRGIKGDTVSTTTILTNADPSAPRSTSNPSQIPLTDINSVTVPGAAAGWTKTVEEFGSGRLGMQEILAPAIRMAREGVPTQELCSEAVSHLPPPLLSRRIVSRRTSLGARGTLKTAVATIGKAHQERIAECARVSDGPGYSESWLLGRRLG